MFVPANATDFPTWSIQVTQTTPFWFYCQQKGHCGQGMVGAINANESSPNTYAAFQAKAQATASGAGTTGNGTTPPSSSGTTTPSGTSSASPTASSGAASAKIAALNVQLGGGIGAALMGLAFGLML